MLRGGFAAQGALPTQSCARSRGTAACVNRFTSATRSVSPLQADYLSPYLPKIVGARGLTREEALKVREDCLKALRDRLIERANIIQARAPVIGCLAMLCSFARGLQKCALMSANNA